MSETLEGLSEEQIRALAETAMSLGNNPGTRRDFQRLVKKAHPDVNIPEIETDERVAALEASFNTRLSEFEKQQKVADATRRVTEKRQELISKGLAKDQAEITAIEKIMVERGVGDYEVAATYYRAQNQPAAPTPHAIQLFEPPKDELKMLRESGPGELKRHAINLAHQVAAEFRAGKTG